MGAVKELGRRSVKERWEEVHEYWEETEDAREWERTLLKRTIEGSMVAELEMVLGAASYERTSGRRGYRNGYRTRMLVTSAGVIPDLLVPRAAGVVFEPTVLARYEQRREELRQVISRLYFEGVSTRSMGPVIEMLFDWPVSASTVSAITREISREVQAFHKRRLDGDYRFLFLDGVVVSSRHGASHNKQVLLSAMGITHEGEKVFLDYRRARSESEAEWRVLLNSLQMRGVSPERLELITTDGNKGLEAALMEVYPDVPHQRCWAHRLRNLAAKCRQANQEQCLREATLIYLAPTRREAIARFKRWARRWETVEPKAVACLAADLEELLAVYRVDDPRLHKTLRTTNHIERFFREVRRRTRPMGCFQNMDSAERVMYVIATKLNARWEARPLPHFKSPHST